jgi:HK97 family phage portal protein
MAKIIDWYKQTKSYLAKEMRVFNGSSITPTSNLPLMANWMYMAKLGMPRQINIVELRQYAKSAWVQMVINTICKQIMINEWEIMSDDEDEDVQQKYEEQIEQITTFLNQPNRNGASFWDIWIPWLRDVLELDAGVIYKGKNASGELVELFPYDGARFLINLNEYGIIGEDSQGEPAPGYYQYSFKLVNSAPIPFEKEEIVYGRMNTNTELQPYGFSPLQGIQQEVELMIQSTRFNKERFSNSAVPDGIVSVPMDQEQMMQFRNAWENEIKGRPHKLIFHNSDANFTPLAMSNKDMEWLEGQKWYFHLVFGAYGLSPMEAGFHEDGNRATGESQERTTVKNAIKPYLELIASKINREIIPDLVGHDELKFKWFAKDDAAEKIEHDQMMSKLNANVLTINEVRAMEGLDPVEWGNQPMAIGMQDRALEQANAESDDNPKDRDNKKEDRDNSKEDAEEARKLYKQLFKGFMSNG